MRVMIPVLTVVLAAGPWAVGEDVEARLSLDVKDAPVESIVGVLVELGGRQVVFDQGIDCSLTLKLHDVRWRQALEVTLRACGLGQDEMGGVLWVATVARLREEAESRRGLKEAKPPAAGGGLALYRLSYARAESMVPLLKRLLAPDGDVSVDSRTNTLVIRY